MVKRFARSPPYVLISRRNAHPREGPVPFRQCSRSIRMAREYPRSGQSLRNDPQSVHPACDRRTPGSARARLEAVSRLAGNTPVSASDPCKRCAALEIASPDRRLRNFTFQVDSFFQSVAHTALSPVVESDATGPRQLTPDARCQVCARIRGAKNSGIRCASAVISCNRPCSTPGTATPWNE